MFLFGFVFVKPRAVPLFFRLNVQTDYYNGHPRHFADELPDYLGWIQLGPVSTYGANEAFPWKIITEMMYHLMNVDKSETRHKLTKSILELLPIPDWIHPR